MLNLGEYRRRPRRLPDYLPWAGLVAPGVLLNKDGSFQATIGYRGPRPRQRHARRHHGGRVPPQPHPAPVRHRLVPAPRGAPVPGRGLSTSRVAVPGHGPDRRRAPHLVRAPGAALRDRLLPHPDLPAAGRDHAPARALVHQEPGRCGGSITGASLERFVARVDETASLLAAFMPAARRLDDAATLSYLHGTVSTHFHAVACPELPFYLDQLLADCRLTGGFTPTLGGAHLRTLSIRGYPTRTAPGMLEALDSLPIEHRYAVRWLGMGKAEAARTLMTWRRHWWSGRKGIGAVFREAATRQESVLLDSEAEVRALDIESALQEAAQDVASMGYLTPTVTVWDRDLERVAEKVRLVQQVVEGAQLVSEVEDVNAVEAWLGSLPGQAYADVRRAIVSSLNLCHLLPLSSVWAGVQWNRHLDAPPLLTTITRGSTPFRLDLFQGDVGHTAVVGPTGAGKSTLLALLTAQWLRYRTAQVFFFDKGRSSRCLTLALGGDFLDLGEPGAIGLQPLADVDDPGERAWAVEWLTDLVARERVAITPEIKTELWAALATLAAQPRHQRTLTVLRALVQTRSVSEALEPFTLQGAFGHLLDAEAVRLGGGRVQAFEMEVLMGQRTAVAPVLTAIFRLFERQLVWTVAGALTGTAWAPSSEAQPVMLDPANLAQTTLTAARELQALLNQVQQFDSETRMLAGLDLDTSGGLDGLLGRIIGLLQQAQGIGYRTVQLDGPYSQGYPATFAGQDWPALQAQAQAWVTANRQTAREAMEEQNATVLAMPGTQARLGALLDASAAIAMGLGRDRLVLRRQLFIDQGCFAARCRLFTSRIRRFLHRSLDHLDRCRKRMARGAQRLGQPARTGQERLHLRGRLTLPQVLDAPTRPAAPGLAHRLEDAHLGDPAETASFVGSRIGHGDEKSRLPPHASGATNRLNRSTTPSGAVSPKNSSRFCADTRAPSRLRGKRAPSYAARAASMSSGLAMIDRPSSAPSYMARLAPSPANGDMRCAASPTKVRPACRGHSCPTGSAWIGRSIGSAMLPVMKLVRCGAQPANCSAMKPNPARASLKSMNLTHSSGAFSAT